MLPAPEGYGPVFWSSILSQASLGPEAEKLVESRLRWERVSRVWLDEGCVLPSLTGRCHSGPSAQGQAGAVNPKDRAPFQDDLKR